jgi:uncharacterized protein (TIGR02099 family)
VSQSTAITTLILRKLWTSIAVILVVFALFISLLRYSLPLLNDRKELIEQYVQSEYNIEVSIGKVLATWKSSGPSIQLEDVYVRQGPNSPVSLKVGDVYLAVEFWASIFNAKLQSKNVILSDLHVKLDLQQIQAAPSSDYPIVKALESVFLEQLSNFSVRNSEFTLRTEANENKIRIKQLSWLNRDNRHQGLGELTLEGFASNTALFILDLTGDVDSYDGVLYAKGKDLDISPWVNEFGSVEASLVASKGNFAVWADIKQGRFTGIRGAIDSSEFAWKTASNQALNTRISAQFSAIPEAQQWLFSVKDLALESDNQVFNSDWKGSYSASEGLYLNNKAPLSLTDALPLTAIINDGLSSQLSQMALNANLPSVHLQINKDGLHLVSEASQLSWQENSLIPGLDELNVDSYWSKDQGALRLYSNNAVLNANALFDRNLALHQMEIPVKINADDQGFRVHSSAGSIVLDELNIIPQFSYRSSDGLLSLLTKIEQFALNKVPSFLPNKLMGANAKTYLSRAFIGEGEGEVQSAHVLWHGRPADFPFEDESGVFQAAVDINNADFEFSNLWPALHDLDIKLLFENLALQMASDSGRLEGVALSNLRAEIPQLNNNAMLTILADGQSDGTAVAELFLKSNLANSLGRVLSQDVIVSGPVSTELGLFIPLSAGNKVRAVGKAMLSRSKVTISALGLDFSNAEGVISFDNENLSISELQASLLDQAVSIDLKGQQLPDAYDLDIDILGSWDLAPLSAQYTPNLSERLSGNADWQLNVGVTLQDGDYAYTAKLTSDLINVGADLPMPFDKVLGQTLPLVLNANGNNMASNINLSLGKDVTFEGVLPHKERQFSRAHLALGQTDFVGMGVGFSISANLPSVDLEHWFASVSAIVGGLSQSKQPILSSPERIFAQTDQLLVAGSRITDVNVTAKRLDRDWQLEIDADQARGTVDISQDWVSKGIRIDADYLKLGDVELNSSDKSVRSEFDPKSLPLIKLVCQRCEIADINLGRLVLDAEPNDDGLEITRLQIEAQSGNINATGQWYKRHQDHFTFIAGDIDSNDFGRLLTNFGLDSGIKDSQAQLDFALTWQQSPLDFEFAQLDGQINWALSDGYLTEVSDKGSRIFTLLSLNSLVRKLSLDFRDVFAKGFFYDEMEGSLQITDGKADTRDTKIDGAAGEIEIYGYSDLVSKELNYNISFTPNVTGNLPVLVYFFTVSPPSALAALALDQVLTSAKVISNVNYSVSGTFDDPILIETGRQSTDVALPTRRDAMQDEQRPLFLPPTEEDLLPIERQDD